MYVCVWLFLCSGDSPSSLEDKNLSSDHECEVGIAKFVPWIAVGHHEACQMMTSGDPEGRTFLSGPHENNRFVF